MRRRLRPYLKNHLDHLVIHRLRTNQPLTATDLLGLERTLAEIGEDDGQTLLTGLLALSEAHDSGLCAADAATKRRFANDPLNLTLSDPYVNRNQKRDKDASEWMP